MKKYILSAFTLSLITLSLNAQRTVENPALKSKAEVVSQRTADSPLYYQKPTVTSNNTYPQYIFILATENLNGEITDIEVTGEISFDNVEIKTREDKENILASMKASEELENVENLSDIFKLANQSFTFENHNIVQFEKSLKHYILFSTK